MKKKWIKMLSAVCLTASLAILGRTEAFADTLTMTLERSVLGGDLLIEPKVVEFTPGENYAQVFTRELGKHGYECAYDGSVASGFYLQGIKGVDCGYNPPPCVKKLLSDFKMSVEKNNNSGGLFEMDYTSSSGWMYYVNNHYMMGMSSEKPQQGDVARFMFTLCKGDDLTGEKWDANHENLTGRHYQVGDKTELVRLMGQVNQEPDRLRSDSALQAAYAQALGTLKKVDASPNSVTEAFNALKQAAEAQPTPTPVITEEPTPPPVITEEPTPPPVITEEPTPSPVITEEPTPPPVITEEPTPSPVITEEPTPPPVITEEPTPSPVITEEPTPSPVITEEPTPPPAITETPKPSKPEAPAKAAISKASSAGYDKLKITWKKVKNASGYQISRATSKKGKYTTVATLGGGIVSYTDSGLTVGQVYYYKVRAFAGSGSQSAYGAWSEIKSARPALTAPSTLRATAGKAKATLKWSKVKGASGYEVFRSGKKSSGYKKIAAKTAGSVSYTNKKLTAKKAYYYKVRAYRTVGTKKVYGGFSPVGRVKAK